MKSPNFCVTVLIASLTSIAPVDAQDAVSVDGKMTTSSSKETDETAGLRKRITQYEKVSELLNLDLKKLAASGSLRAEPLGQQLVRTMSDAPHSSDLFAVGTDGNDVRLTAITSEGQSSVDANSTRMGHLWDRKRDANLRVSVGSRIQIGESVCVVVKIQPGFLVLFEIDGTPIHWKVGTPFSAASRLSGDAVRLRKPLKQVALDIGPDQFALIAESIAASPDRVKPSWYFLKYAAATSLAEILQEIYAGTALRIAVDNRLNAVIVHGDQKVVKQSEQLIKALDIDNVHQRRDEEPANPPTLKLYSLRQSDPKTVLLVLQTLMAGMSNVRLALDPATKRIVVLAGDSGHAVVNAAIEKFELHEQDAAIFSADGKQLEVSVDTRAGLHKRIKQLEKENELLKLDLERLAASGNLCTEPLGDQIEQRKAHPRTHSDHPQPSGVRRTQPRASEQVDGTRIRCDVGSLDLEEMRVRSIAPDGKQVSRDDLLVEFESDSIERTVSEQKLNLNAAEAKLQQSRLVRDRIVTAAEGKQTEAKAAVDEAKLAVTAYSEGDRVVGARALEAAVKMAQLDLKHAKRLQVTVGQGKVDQIEVEKADVLLDVAKLRLDVFTRYSVPKMTQMLENKLAFTKRAHEAICIETEAQINRAEAMVKAQQVLVETERSRGERLAQQLRLCRVTAPHDGVVAHLQNVPPVKEGSLVRNRQVLLMLRSGAKDGPK